VARKLRASLPLCTNFAAIMQKAAKVDKQMEQIMLTKPKPPVPASGMLTANNTAAKLQSEPHAAEQAAANKHWFNEDLFKAMTRVAINVMTTPEIARARAHPIRLQSSSATSIEIAPLPSVLKLVQAAPHSKPSASRCPAAGPHNVMCTSSGVGPVADTFHQGAWIPTKAVSEANTSTMPPMSPPQ